MMIVIQRTGGLIRTKNVCVSPERCGSDVLAVILQIKRKKNINNPQIMLVL